MDNITPAIFTDSFSPLGEIVINEKNYSILPPNCLPEKFYINYYEARADIMDIVAKYSPPEEASDLVKQASQARMDGVMIAPARRQIEALASQERDSLHITPGVVISVYNEVEKMLQAYYKEMNRDQEETSKPTKSSRTKKNSSETT